MSKAIQAMSSLKAVDRAIYSASVVLRVVSVCNLDCQTTGTLHVL